MTKIDGITDWDFSSVGTNSNGSGEESVKARFRAHTIKISVNTITKQGIRKINAALT
jgi:hypothetical protein